MLTLGLYILMLRISYVNNSIGFKPRVTNFDSLYKLFDGSMP